MSNEGEIVTTNENHTWIKDHLKVETNPIYEALASQGVVVDEEMADFNCYGHKVACYTASNPWGGDKGFNDYSITEVRIAIYIRAFKYNEYVGLSIDPNIMEWSRIKHFKYLVQTWEKWSDP